MSNFWQHCEPSSRRAFTICRPIRLKRWRCYFAGIVAIYANPDCCARLNIKDVAQLQPEDRITLASFQQQNYSILAIARLLHRSPITISRELSRNADVNSCSSSQRKLHVCTSLFGVLHHFLLARWSPQYIALTPARIHQRSQGPRVTRDDLQLQLCSARRRAGNCSPVCGMPTTNEHRAAKAKTDEARYPTCSASMCVHLRLKTGSSPGNGGATSSKARPMRLPCAHWSSEPAGC